MESQLTKFESNASHFLFLASTAVSAAAVWASPMSYPQQEPLRKQSSPAALLVLQNVEATHDQPPTQKDASDDQEVQPDPTQQLKPLRVWLGNTDIQPDCRDAILESIRKHPDEQRWSGTINGQLFAVVAINSDASSPARQAIRLTAQRRAHMLAVHEILLAKSILDVFAEQQLDDAVTLRKAVTQAKLQLGGSSNAIGKTKVTTKGSGPFLESGSRMFKTRVAAFVLANQSGLIAHLTNAPQLDHVRNAYRAVMHTEARRLMELQQWKDALDLWHHLHSRKLVSPQLYIDAATCFQRQKQKDNALKVLEESFAAYRKSNSLVFFETVGDLALEIGSPDAEALAAAAFNRAIELL
jgi:hypothetical protein